LVNDPDEQRDLYGQAEAWPIQAELMERHVYAYMRAMETWRYERLPLDGGRPMMPGPTMATPLEPAYPGNDD